MKIVLVSMMLTVLSWSAHGGLIRVSNEQSITDLSTESSLVLDVTDGKLFGAFNVDVSGILYDVAFVDGVFSDIFGDDGSKLDATTKEQAEAFSIALGDLVFIDSGIGLFDSDLKLTNGCNGEFINECSIATGNNVINRPNGIFFQAADFSNSTSIDDGSIGSISGQTRFNSRHHERLIFADWSVSPTRSINVPEPSGMILLGLGLVG